MSLHDMFPPKFDAKNQQAMWSAYKPHVVQVLENLERAEGWVPELDTETIEALERLVTVMAKNDRRATRDECKRLGFCLAGVNARQCIYALVWLDRRQVEAASNLISFVIETRETNPYSAVIWTRIEGVAKHHLVDDVVALLRKYKV